MSLLGANNEEKKKIYQLPSLLFALAVSCLAMSFPEAGKEYHCSTEILSKAWLMVQTQERGSPLIGKEACVGLDF